MKKGLDKLIDNVKFDKRYVFFMLVIAIVGIITGSLFIIILNNADKELVIEYIQSFIESINSNSYRQATGYNLQSHRGYGLPLKVCGYRSSAFRDPD